MKNRLLIAFFVLGTIMLTAMKTRTINELPKEKVNTITWQVSNAKFYQGIYNPQLHTDALDVAYVAVEIENLNGYFIVETSSQSNKHEVLLETFKQYDSRYLQASVVDKVVMEKELKAALLESGCTQWVNIDPNAGTMERQCRSCFIGICIGWTERCPCGYCCNVEI